jgi:hypothetical protein
MVPIQDLDALLKGGEFLFLEGRWNCLFLSGSLACWDNDGVIRTCIMSQFAFEIDRIYSEDVCFRLADTNLFWTTSTNPFNLFTAFFYAAFNLDMPLS